MQISQISSATICIFLAGCNVLVTTDPLVKHGGKYLRDGRYVLKLKDFETPIHFTIAYDKTNSIYQIDAGKEGTFQALCRHESPDMLLVSLTLSNQTLKNAYGVLAESERLFIARVYVNARLVRQRIGYDLWLLNSAKAISDGCRVSGLPADRLLPLLPSTNAPPFVHAGKLFRIGEDGGIQDGECPQLPLTNDVDRLGNGDKMLISFMCDKGSGKAVKMTKSEDSKYLYYHMKFTNQQESCTIRIDRKSGKATTIKQAEP